MKGKKYPPISCHISTSKPIYYSLSPKVRYLSLGPRCFITQETEEKLCGRKKCLTLTALGQPTSSGSHVQCFAQLWAELTSNFLVKQSESGLAMDLDTGKIAKTRNKILDVCNTELLLTNRKSIIWEIRLDRNI